MGREPPCQVLVVEDEALIRFTIADELRDEGYDVLEAGSADEALRILETHPDIRLLFTDVDMPGSIDGLRLSRLVSVRWPPVRIIVTSGKMDPAMGSLPGGSQFVPKPYVAAEVIRVMREVLASA